MEVARVTAVLVAETPTQKATSAWDSATIRVKDVKYQTTLVEREAWERVSRVEAENIMVWVSAHEDVEGLVQKITLLEGELAEACRAREVAEENSRGLSDAAGSVEHQWEVSKREREEHFEEVTLLHTRGSELCPAIVGPPRVRNHLSEAIQIAALHHTMMAEMLAVLRAVVSSTLELVLRHSPDETFWVEVMGELVVVIQRLEEQRSQLERPGSRIYDLLLGLPTGRVWLDDHLDKATGQLGAELVAWQEADIELETLWISVA
jgi:hypothetical protein